MCTCAYIHHVIYHWKAWLFAVHLIPHLPWLLLLGVHGVSDVGAMSKNKSCKNWSDTDFYNGNYRSVAFIQWVFTCIHEMGAAQCTEKQLITHSFPNKSRSLHIGVILQHLILTLPQIYSHCARRNRAILNYNQVLIDRPINKLSNGPYRYERNPMNE